jgi:hypothetical protein
MRRVKLGSESGRIWAGMGGVLLMAAGAALVAMVAFSTDSPAGRVPVAQADHNTLTEAQIEALPNGTKIVICHTEGNGSQHDIEVASEAFLNAGHFDAPGNPLHDVGDVHDFIISVEGMGVINDEECGAVAATPTSTQAVATSTQQAEATSTPTATVENTATPTNTPEPTATLAIATSTQQAEATSTPTATIENTATPTNTAEPTATEAVPPTNTPEPTATTSALLPANTPTATPPTLVIVESQAVQATPVPAQQAQVLGVQATPPPSVRALPATGSGGYEDNSMALIIGMAMILAGTTISWMAIRRLVR